MACTYTYQGKTYSASEFDDVLRSMPPSVASKYIPGVSSVPSAPFVTDTKAWVALGIKRAILHAAQVGADGVVFGTGQQNADLYDLSKQVETLAVSKDGDGFKVSFTAVSGGIQPVQKAKNASDLEAMIGKELASKAVKYLADRPRSMAVYTGLDLKVGGEGMMAFYDKIVPSVANEVLRKIGGGKVAPVGIAGGINTMDEEIRWSEYGDGTQSVEWNGGQREFDTEAEAQAFVDSLKANVTQPGFQITDAMRAKLDTEGMPLFSRTQGTGASTRDIKALVKRIRKANANYPETHVFDSPADLDLDNPTHKRLHDFLVKHGAMLDVEAATHDGEFYVFANHMSDEARAEHVMALHEPTHYGLRAVFGAELDPILQSIWATNSGVRQQATALRKKFNMDSNIGAVEEVLADMTPAELVKLKGWRRLVQFMRDWFKTHGFAKTAERLDAWMQSGLSDQQRADLFVADVVNAARQWVKDGKPGMAGNVYGSLMGRFDPKLQRVWHGTPHIWAPEPGFTHGHGRTGDTITVDGVDRPTTNSNPDIRLSRSGQKPWQGGNPELDAFRKKAGITSPVSFKERIRNFAARIFDTKQYLRTEAMDQIRAGMFDRFYGALRVEKKLLGGLPTEQSAYVAMRLSTGVSSVMRGLLMHGVPRWAANGMHLEKTPDTRGLLDVLAPVQEDLNDWLAWMVANRANRLMREGKENNFTQAEIDAGLGLSAGREERFKQAASEFAAFKRGVLDMAEKAGLIDASTRPMWDHADWIPFYREMDQMVIGGPRNKRGLSHQSSGIRQLRGGDSALHDPLENIVMNFHHLVDASLKNNALRMAVDQYGDLGVIEKVGMQFKQALVPANEVKRQLQEHGIPEQMLSVMPKEVFQGIAKMWQIVPPADKDVVRIMRDGKAEYYRVTDPLLLRALTGYNSFNLPGLEIARATKRILTTGVTATVDFWLRNFPRDVLSAQIISKDRPRIRDSFKGIVESYRETGYAEDMMFAGASFQGGFIDGTDAEQAARTIRRSLRSKGFSASSADEWMSTLLDSPLKFWHAYERIGSAVENANREAVSKAVNREGGGLTEAMYEAKDLMDFSMRGDWPVIQMMADTIPFFNARLQGLYRLARTDPRMAAIRGGLMLTVPTVLLTLLNSGDDEYEQLKDWEKDGYWHFFTPVGHYRLAKPFEVGVIFATIPERLTQAMMGEDSPKKFGERLAWNLMEQLNLVQMPQVVAPAMEVAYNWDSFRQSNIEGTFEQKSNLPHMRYNERTSYTFRALAETFPDAANYLGASPKRMEHLWHGYFGTLGGYALGISDYIVHGLSDAPVRPERRLDQYPILKVLYQQDPPFTTQDVDDIYRMADDIDQIYGSIRESIQKGDKDEADRLKVKYADRLLQRGTLQGARTYLSYLRKRIERIERDENMTPEAKRAEIDRLIKERNKKTAEWASKAKGAWGY